jgi:type IV pilus assembly protein PilA
MNNVANKMQVRGDSRRSNFGFPFVELIIVVAILAISVGIVVTQVIPYLNISRESKDYQIINKYSTAATAAYSAYEEECTDVTRIVVGGTNSDTVGMPASTLESEIEVLTGYDTIDACTDRMSSKQGSKITSIEITVNPTKSDVDNVPAMTIQTQAYNGETKVFDSVVSNL